MPGDELGIYPPGYPVRTPDADLAVDLVLEPAIAALKAKALAVQAGAAADRSGAQPPTAAAEEEARTEHHRPAPAADAPWPTRAEVLTHAQEAIARRLSRR